MMWYNVIINSYAKFGFRLWFLNSQNHSPAGNVIQLNKNKEPMGELLLIYGLSKAEGRHKLHE